MVYPNRESELGKLIGQYLTKKDFKVNNETIHLLFSANRWEEKEIIHETLNKGINIVCDRYAYSGVAYSNAKGLDFEWAKSSDKGLPKPDIVFYIDMPVEECRKRTGFG